MKTVRAATLFIFFCLLTAASAPARAQIGFGSNLTGTFVRILPDGSREVSTMELSMAPGGALFGSITQGDGTRRIVLGELKYLIMEGDPRPDQLLGTGLVKVYRPGAGAGGRHDKLPASFKKGGIVGGGLDADGTILAFRVE